MKAMDKADRENTIVDMYVNGHSFEDIMAVSGYNSRSSVFSVLNRHGVKSSIGENSKDRWASVSRKMGNELSY